MSSRAEARRASDDRRDTEGVTDKPVRRRAAKPTKEGRAVHREVRFGMAELVPDLSRTGSWLLFTDGTPQSQVDLYDPGYLEFEYVRRIGHVADLAFPAGEPLRALHLGGGALTLPRYLAYTRPGSRQLVAELDAPLTDLVRRHLPLPTGHRIRVRAADAREVLESVRPASYDLVISDVFMGARTPFHLTTAECARAAARSLRPGGVYAVNVADGPVLERARRAVATIRSEYKETCMIAEPAVLRGRRLGNLVLAGSDGPLPVAELRHKVAGDPFPARVVDGDELARFASGAPVVTDATKVAGSGPQSTNW
jgi:spermidine synthase